MKRSKCTDSQIAFILRQADEGAAVAEVCRKADCVSATAQSSPPADKLQTSGRI